MAQQIPVTSNDDGLREWDITTDDGLYFIRDEDGDWTLYQRTGPCPALGWQEVGMGVDIDIFLYQHTLTLAE